MRRVAMPGFRPETDTVELNHDYLFTSQVELAKVRRGTLRAVMPSVALFEPWPEEFLWRPLKLLGVVDVWWSMHRSWSVPGDVVDCVYQTMDMCEFTQPISRELIADTVAWQAYRRHQLRTVLCSYQDSLDEREQSAAKEYAREPA